MEQQDKRLFCVFPLEKWGSKGGTPLKTVHCRTHDAVYPYLRPPLSVLSLGCHWIFNLQSKLITNIDIVDVLIV